MQNFTLIITALVFTVFGCKLQPVSEKQNIGRAGKGALQIVDMPSAIRQAVAKFKLTGDVDELAALIKGGKHHPDDVAAAIAAFKKVTKDQSGIVDSRIKQLASKIDGEKSAC